jgi:hypothetical protein
VFANVGSFQNENKPLELLLLKMKPCARMLLSNSLPILLLMALIINGTATTQGFMVSPNGQETKYHF